MVERGGGDMSVPVRQQTKKAVPWWVWLLLAVLAILAGLWLLFALFNDGEDPDVAELPATTAPATAAPPESAPNTADTAPITDLLIVVDTNDPAALIGRRVELQSVLVQSVVGDKTFWVGPSQDQQLFVVLDEERDPPGVEGLVDVDQGQQVSIGGTVEKLPPIEQARQQFDLSADNTADLNGAQLYLRAERVEVLTQ
jgi:hypothetical protein